jgi:hypothetical protein
MQSTETRTEKSTEKSTEMLTSKVYQVNQDSTEAANRNGNDEVGQVDTEADLQRRLLSQAPPASQCHSGLREIFYEALHEGSRERTNA